jgi:zinc transport system ATP-binding protein
LGEVSALTDINATILPGSITAVIGPNGAGKTTLLRTIMRMVPHSGIISFTDEGGTETIPQTSYVPQSMDIDRGIPMTVYDFMSLPYCHHPLWIPHKKTNLAKIESRLDLVSAKHLIFRQFGKLSGGEMQRVMLAMALMNDPEILLMDEPDAGIDVMGEKMFHDLLKNIQAEGNITMILVSHDLSLVNSLSDNVICINRKIQCMGSNTEVLTSANLRELFGGDSAIYLHDHSHGNRD